MSQVKRNLPMETKTNVGSVRASLTDVPEISDEGLAKWVNDLYESRPTDEDFKRIIEAFSYKGFNRKDVLKQLAKLNDTRLVTELVILCSMQGPQRASVTKLTNGKTPVELGIPASGGQGTKVLTCNRITAATADLAAFYLKKMDFPKRIQMDLPGWLQFPAAGAIAMPENLRKLHYDFSMKFSTMIGGVFQEQIYMAMQANAYLEPKLKLFN
jgi:hypothetical protein